MIAGTTAAEVLTAPYSDAVIAYPLNPALHLVKVLGIFARLWYRDGKSGYLKDLPLTLEYVRDTCTRYPELAGLSRIVEQYFVPQLPLANARVRKAQG